MVHFVSDYIQLPLENFSNGKCFKSTVAVPYVNLKSVIFLVGLFLQGKIRIRNDLKSTRCIQNQSEKCE
jgi:hypothetical protein